MRQTALAELQAELASGSLPTIEASSHDASKKMPLKIFINGRFLSQSLTGVQRYAAEMVKAMDRLLASGEVDQASLSGRILLRIHLLMCDDCGRYAAELEEITRVAREALRQPLDPARLAELERSVLRGMGGNEPGSRT